MKLKKISRYENQNIKIKFIVAAIAMITSFNASLSMAKKHPPDYAIKKSCQNQGPVKVCRALQTWSNLAVLDIFYNGYLKNSQGLSIWIKVNYLDGSRTLSIPVILNSLGSVRITGGCLVGRSKRCEILGSKKFKDLLVYAQRADGTLNALDLEIAFFDDYGSWDNNGSSHGSYHFYFPQQ